MNPEFKHLTWATSTLLCREHVIDPKVGIASYRPSAMVLKSAKLLF